MCDIIFEKAKGVYAEATIQRFFKKDLIRNFAEFTTCARISFFDKVKLCRSAASFKTRL